MEEHGFVHKSVLLYETVGSLNIKPGGIYVDGTVFIWIWECPPIS